MTKRTFPGCAFIVTLLGAVSGSTALVTPPDVVLQAKVRDFKEMNPNDTVGMNPQFNSEKNCSAYELGIRTVQDALDTTGPADGGLYAGDNRTPRLLDPLPAEIAQCFSPVERFPEWYSDQAPSLNRAFLVDLKFVRDEATGVYRFQDNSFFPIDEGKAFKKFSSSDPDPFGHLQSGIENGVDVSKHNYGFTMELHTQFLYEAGKSQVFTFSGDDDIWVYINGICVVDRGGVHPNEGGEANLDSLKTLLGLVDRNQYPLDFFFAERHTSSSTCTITTNLSFTDAISVVAGPKADPPASEEISFPVDVELTSGTDSTRIYYTLDGSEPDSTKSLYSEPVTLATYTVFKSIAYREGWIASSVSTDTYGTPAVGLRPLVSSRPGFPGTERVSLFDRSGRLLRLVPSGTGAGAATGLDIRDARRLGIPPGVYFWRTQGKGHALRQSGTVLIP